MQEYEKVKSKVVSFDVELKRKIKPHKSLCIGLVFTNDPAKISPLLRSYSKVELFRTAASGSDALDAVDEEGTEGSAPPTATKEDARGAPKLDVPEEGTVLFTCR